MRKFTGIQLNRFFGIIDSIIHAYRTAKLLVLRGKWKLATSVTNPRGTRCRDVDVNKICWVSPQKIAYRSLREFNLHDFKGQVIGGDWDLLEKRFEILDRSVPLKPEDLEEYKSQRAQLLSGHFPDPVGIEEEVVVSVGRYGDLLFSAGAQRLAIAQLLRIPKIPVEIAVRHSSWAKFREEALCYAQEQGGKTYQPMTHPDLVDIPALHECEYRFKLIKENMSARQGCLLDIGANLGYFCHRFEDEGFDCYAVEDYPEHAYFLKKLARAEDKQFKIITESVLNSREIKNTHFNVVLALNIFHHFLKTRTHYHQLIELLKNLQMDELFFESHVASEIQMQNAYRNYAPDEFVEFILRNSCLKQADLIGVMTDGRPLYRLY